MSFFDEDDEPRTSARTRPSSSTRARAPQQRPRPRPQPRRAASAGPVAPDPQTILVRRAVLLALGLVVLLVLVFGIRACQQNATEDALRGYNERVSALEQESVNQIGNPFFQTLTAAGEDSPQDLQVQISQFRVAAEKQLDQAERLDVPDQMAAAQRSFLITLEFRRDALDVIARRIRSVRASEEDERRTAVESIAGQMQALLASDVVYLQRVVPLVQKALEDEDIRGLQTDRSRFLSDIGWLSESTVNTRLGADVSTSDRKRNGSSNDDEEDREIAPGTHGTGLTGTTAGGVKLTPGTANRIPLSNDLVFEVQFTNQGENDEFDVEVVVRVTGGSGDAIRGTKVVDTVPQGQTVTAAVALDSPPPIGEAVTVEVEVRPVPGEKIKDNNKASYPAIFSR